MSSGKMLAKKKDEVKRMTEKYKSAKTIVIVDYLGLSVAQDTVLRTEFRNKGVDYKVLKNRLLKISFNDMGIMNAETLFQGPTAAAMSRDDYVLPARLCTDAEKKYKAFDIKGGVLDGRVVTADEVRALAALPSREQLVANVLGGLNAPISGLINVLSGSIGKLVRVLGAIAESK